MKLVSLYTKQYHYFNKNKTPPKCINSLILVQMY